MAPQLSRIQNAGAEAVLLVTNAPEGVQIVRIIATLPWTAAVFSHWGITGGDFWEEVRHLLPSLDFKFLQTFSFAAPVTETGRAIGQKYCRTYHLPSPELILAPVGTAHAYDLVHLLAIAITKAGSIDSSAVREALEQIDTYRGLVKTYAPPFSAERHDALNRNDYILARYDQKGRIVPVAGTVQR